MERAILNILTKNEELLRQVQKNQQIQADTIDNIIKVTKGLQDDVNTIREEL